MEGRCERSTLEQIIERIGPYGLIAVCVTLAVNVLQKPLDSNTLVSIGILLVVISLSFLQDYFKLKQFRALEELRMQTETELEKHRSWVEGVQQPTVDVTRQRGALRMAMTKAYLSIQTLLDEDIKSGILTEDQIEYTKTLKKRISDIEKAVSFL